DSYVQKVGGEAFRKYIEQNQEDFIFYKTNILLRDAGTDPIKRADVIRDVVESIALIPDEIKVSLFIRQCSVLLDIEERALLTELNKIRIAKSRAKDRKTISTSPSMPPGDGPPADLFLTEDERAQAAPQGVAPVGISPEVLQEREIIRILLNYGQELVTWEGEEQVPVAPYLLASIDDVNFVDEECKIIVDEFKKQAEEFQVPDAKFFLSHSHKAVADLAVDSIAIQYEISPKWNRSEEHTSELQSRENLVCRLLLEKKKKKEQKTKY